MSRIPGMIVALDVEEADMARALVNEIGSRVSYYKIGSRLFTAEGPAMVRELAAGGASIFLDLKFHDIPATVAGSVRAAVSLGTRMMTLHTCGGIDMMKAAAEAADDASSGAPGGRPLLVGVTVLTSMSAGDLESVSGYSGSVEDLVLRRAELAVKSGLDGVVASVMETAAIRREFGDELVIVTPGIRPAGGDAGDQKRTAVPADAREAGSTYIVVGRPVYQAPSPAEAAESILAELAGKRTGP